MEVCDRGTQFVSKTCHRRRLAAWCLGTGLCQPWDLQPLFILPCTTRMSLPWKMWFWIVVVFHEKIQLKNWLTCSSSAKGKHSINVPVSCFSCHRQAARTPPDWGLGLGDPRNCLGGQQRVQVRWGRKSFHPVTWVCTCEPLMDPSCSSKSILALWGNWAITRDPGPPMVPSFGLRSPLPWAKEAELTSGSCVGAMSPFANTMSQHWKPGW